MTVSSQDTVFQHVGNGVSTTFAYGCQVPTATDLRVYLDDVEQTSGFTLTGIGSLTGGTVIFSTAPANGVPIRIERDIELERSTDYQQNGDFLAGVVNPDFDRIWMALQGHLSSLKRTIKVPNSDTTLPQDLPPAAQRANKLLSFNASGQPVAIAPDSQSATDLQILLATVAGFNMIGGIQAGAGAIPRTAEDEFRETIKASQYGMHPIATAAGNTAALQEAIAEATLRGGAQVELLAGNYAMVAGTNFAADDVAIVGRGKVVLDYSAGAGIGFKIDAGGMGALVKRMRVENIHIKGGPAITEAFYSRGVVRSIFRNIEVKEATTNGFAIRFGVLNTYDHCVISDDTGSMNTRPTNYWYLDDDGAVGNHTQANVFQNCEASGQGVGSTKTGWTLVNAILNVWVGGTAESMGIGLDFMSDICRLNLFEGFDVEDNQTYDVRVKGVANTFKNCLFQSPGVVDNVSISTGVITRFAGCYIRKANLGVGSSDTDFETCYFDDAVGNGIQGVGSYKLYNCITNTGGVGGPKTGTMRDVLGPTVAATLQISQGNTPAQTVDKNEAAVAGQQVNVRGRITTNAAGTAGNSIAVSLDSGFPANASAVGLPCGNFMLVTTGGTIYVGTAVLNSDTVLVFRTNASTGNLGINPAVTLASGDVLSFSIAYPLA